MTDVEAWLAILFGYVFAYRRPLEGKALGQHLENLLPIAGPVFKELGSSKQAQYNVIDIILADKADSQGMPTSAYGEALLAVKMEMTGDTQKRAKLKKFLNSTRLTAEQQTMANQVLSLLTPVSDKVDTKAAVLEKQLSQIPDKVLKSLVAEDVVNEQPHHIKELKSLVQRIAKRDDMHLTDEEVKDLKEVAPDRHKQYSELHKKINGVWKAFIRNMVRAEQRHIKITEAVNALREAKIDYHNFDGMIKAGLGNLLIDEEVRLYTPQDKLLNQPIPRAGSTIIKNLTYDPKTEETYYFRYKVPNSIGKSWAKAYTVESRIGTKSEGTDRVLDAMKTVPGKRQAWIKDLSSSDYMRRAYGAMCEIIWELVPRIGSPNSGKTDKETGKKKATYGLSTLKVGHVTINGDTMILNYSGKDGIRQKHILKGTTPEHMRCIQVVKAMMRGKDRNAELWTKPDGKRITGSDFNTYLKKIGINNITAHEFRDVRGTLMMQDMLDKARIPKSASPADISKRMKAMALNVGKLLGHKSGVKITPNMALKSYIAPVVIHRWYQDRGLHSPKWLPKGGRGE